MLNGFYNLLYKKYKKYRSCSGFTLVEVLITMFLITLLAVGLIHGTTTAIKAVTLNKGKTKAIAVANEKIELLKAMDYEDIGLTSNDPGWEIAYPDLSEDGYSIYYYSAWVDNEENGYKQVLVSVLNSNINIPVEVVTRIFPTLSNAPVLISGYPAPRTLAVDHDNGSGGSREIKLVWVAPDTEKVISTYKVYGDGELIGSSLTAMYLNYPADDDDHVFYVTAVYSDNTESNPSNTVVATRDPAYPSPQSLIIDSYVGGSGNNRKVSLAWSTPGTSHTIIGYKIYRDGIYIGTTENESYLDLIGTENYTYYVTLYYEGGIESVPSNSVITE